MKAAWLALGLLGCGGGSDDAPTDATPAPDALLCTHLQNLKTFRGKAQTFGTTNGAPFPGTACVEGRSDIACATPGADGAFEICAPSSGEFGLRFAGTGFETTTYLLGPQAAPQTFTIADATYANAAFWMTATTSTHLVVLVVDQAGAPLADAEIAILPSAGLDVVYIGADGLPEPARTKTTVRGSALVADIMATDYDLQVNSITHPSCAYASGGYVSPDNSQDARIRGITGATVIATIRCTP